MIWAKEASLAVLFVASTSWLLTTKRRRLPDPNDLLLQLQKGQLDKLQPFLTHGDDVLDTDASFWKVSGGYRGLIEKRRQAVLIVQLLQHFCTHAGLPDGEMTYMIERAFMMTFLIGLCIPGALIRCLYRKLPHLGARYATEIYWSIEIRAKTLCRTYRDFDPILADRILAVL